MRIVYLSRGHGYGHAAVDLDVIRALRARGAEVTVGSYGTGLAYYRSRSEPCANLRIDDVDDQGVDAALRVLAFLRSSQSADAPIDLVVAHEVFTAPRMCAMLGLRNVLLTHWFFTELGAPERDAALHEAGSVFLLDFATAHRVPPELADKVRFTGAIANRFEVRRDEARKRLGIGNAELVGVLATGAVIPLNADRLSAVVAKGVAAWSGRDQQAGRLFVLSDVEPPNSVATVEWVGTTSQPDLYYAAADVVLANATFATLCTLARNGVPTIAITGGPNPVDRLHAEFFRKQGLLTTVDATAPETELRNVLEASLASAHALSIRQVTLPWAAPADIADQLLDAERKR